MALPFGLNDLAKLTLLASDASYFTNSHPVLPGIALAALSDTSYGVASKYTVPSGFYEVAQRVDPNTGFGFIAYRKDGATPADTEIIVALRGTDGLNPRDWVANSQYLGWNQWNERGGGRDLVFGFLDSLRSDPTVPGTAFEGKIHFTGQSLGGALAQYAAYQYVKSHQGLTGFNKANITLTTFNGFGGVLGLEQNAGGYQSSVLANIGSNAHFYTEGDLVSRLGHLNGVGHTGGTAYMLKAHATEIDPDTGESYLLGPIDAHRIETGFYPFLLPGVEFEAAQARPIEYLPMQHVQELAALYGRVFNDQNNSPLESMPRLVAGVIAGLTLGRPEETNVLVQAVLTHLHAANKIGDEWYGFLRRYDWGEIAGSPFLVVPGAGLYGLSLLTAVLIDALEVQVDRQVQLFNTVREWVSNDVPTVSQGVSSEDRRLQAEMMLALVPGAAIGSKLAGILQPLNLDVNQFAQTLTTTGENWLREALDMIRERANTLDLNLATLSAKLTSAIADMAVDIGSGSTTVQGYINTVLLPFVRDTAQGIGNAVGEFVQDVAGAFNLGRVLNLADIRLIDRAYAAELNDPRLSSSARVALEEAQAIVQRAGQTVVVQAGIGANPFDQAGFNPDAAPLATINLNEGQLRMLTINVPFEAGAGGQKLKLILGGPNANTFVLRSNGIELSPNGNTFTVTIPEGQKRLVVGLQAKQDVSVSSSLTVTAQLLDANNAATHNLDNEATIALTDIGDLLDGTVSTIDYNNGYDIEEVVLGEGPVEFNGSNQWMVQLDGPTNYVVQGNYGPEVILADGFIGTHWAQNQQVFGGAGSDLIAGDFNDRLYGEAGDDQIRAGWGSDVVYGGAGRDLVYADMTYYGRLSAGTYNDYLDGGSEEDSLSGMSGHDTLLGGTGNDELFGDDNAAYVQRPEGNDYLDGGDGHDELFAGLGDDVLYGGIGNDRLFGDNQPGGEDQYRWVERPRINAGSDNEWFQGYDFTISVGNSIPLFSVTGGRDYLEGEEGDDYLQGDAGDDVLLGGVGIDVLWGDDQQVGVLQEGDD